MEASGVHRQEALTRQAVCHASPLTYIVGPHGFLKEASTCRIVGVLAILWGITGTVGGASWARDNQYSRVSLQGVGDVKVVVEPLDSQIEQAGLTTQQLQTDVELRLRLAGIRVLTDEEVARTPGRPALYVNTNILRSSGGLTAYNVSVELHQAVFLETDSSLVNAATWGVGGVGTVGRSRLDEIRNSVRDLVDNFINAYLNVRRHSNGSGAPSSTSLRR